MTVGMGKRRRKKGGRKKFLTVLDAIFLCHKRLGVLFVQAFVKDAFWRGGGKGKDASKGV